MKVCEVSYMSKEAMSGEKECYKNIMSQKAEGDNAR